jgi:hypothetical protein
MPAIKIDFHTGTPAIVPAPMTPRPDAAKVAKMRIMIFRNNSFFIFSPFRANPLAHVFIYCFYDEKAHPFEQ